MNTAYSNLYLNHTIYIYIYNIFPSGDRDIKSLQVRCTNLDVSGCPWVGELRELAGHVVKCSSELYFCRYSSAGCQVKKFKKDLPDHEAECAREHLALSMDRIKHLEAEVDKLRGFVEKSSAKDKDFKLAPVTFRFPDFENRSRLMATENVSWGSRPFYSHQCGYKFYLRLQFEMAPIFSVSVMVCLMKGENDANLVWPFRGKVKFEILHQGSNDEHLSGMARFMEVRETSRNCRVTGTADKSEAGWGAIRLLTIGHPNYEEFFANGSLYMRVNSVEVSDLNKFWLLDGLAC